MFAFGIDIGGTKIAAALVAPDGSIVRDAKLPTPAQDSEAIVQAVAQLVREMADGVEVVAVGVAAAGFIDSSRSTVIYAPNLSWRDEPLKEKLQAVLGLPVFIENDANAAGWAEHRFGAGRNVNNMMLLTIGTGVGGAVVVDGRLLRGGFGIAAELGHIRLVPGGRPCGCGQLGCLEQYGSGTALLRSAKDLILSEDGSGARLAELQAQNGELTGAQVYQAITERDPGAIGLLNQLATHIGEASASLCAVLDPELIIIGGGVSAAGELLLAPMRQAYESHQPAAGHRPKARFEIAQLVNDAGVVGAADLARREFVAQ